jgi:GNAT superfamily N-acetyltransferase
MLIAASHERLNSMPSQRFPMRIHLWHLRRQMAQAIRQPQRRDAGWPLVAWCSAVLVALTLLLLAWYGAGAAGIRVVIRATARTSLLLFTAAFIASASARRWLYSYGWWTQGRERRAVKRMLEGSDVIVGYCDPSSDRLVAFARVLTDFVYKALILDVIVAAAHRKSGLGRRLLDDLLEHPELREVLHFELYCLPNMLPFYERWGFSAALGDLRFMRYERR